MTRRAVVGGVLVMVLVAAVVVGVVALRNGDEGALERIPRDEVPFALLEDPPSPAISQPGDGSEGATLFFVYEDALVPVSRPKLKHADPGDVLEQLLEGPTARETGVGISSALDPAAEVGDVTVSEGRASVDLGEPFPETLDGTRRALALAQIVFTLTEIRDVRDVRFLLDGEAVEVPVGDGTLTKRAVSRNDYPVSVLALPPGSR